MTFASVKDSIVNLFSSEKVTTSVEVAVEQVTYPYIWEGLDNGYDFVRPMVVLADGNKLTGYPLPYGETKTVTFMDGVTAEVGYDIEDTWSEMAAYDKLSFELYTEFVRTLAAF